MDIGILSCDCVCRCCKASHILHSPQHTLSSRARALAALPFMILGTVLCCPSNPEPRMPFVASAMPSPFCDSRSCRS